MNLYQFIASLVGSLAWPFAALIIALILRRPLRSLLERARSAEAFGVKFNFARLQQVVEVVEEIQMSLPPGSSRNNARPSLDRDDRSAASGQSPDDRELDLASPIGSIVASWNRLEVALRHVAEVNGMSWRSGSVVAQMKRLVEARLISRALADAIETLRQLRSEALHASKVAGPSPLDASRYRHAVETVLSVLDNGDMQWNQPEVQA